MFDLGRDICDDPQSEQRGMKAEIARHRVVRRRQGRLTHHAPCVPTTTIPPVPPPTPCSCSCDPVRFPFHPHQHAKITFVHWAYRSSFASCFTVWLYLFVRFSYTGKATCIFNKILLMYNNLCCWECIRLQVAAGNFFFAAFTGKLLDMFWLWNIVCLVTSEKPIE